MTKTYRFFLHLVFVTTILLLEGFQQPIFGQVFDDFSDGNFTTNPTWMGDTVLFQISNSSAIPAAMKPALQLNGTDPDTASIYLENALLNEVEWTFWIKLSFNTSANNFARVYLVSDQENLEGPLNGYYLQIGGTNDSIGLFKQSGIESELILNGQNAYTGSSTNTFRIKVNRHQEGLWELFADSEGGNNFQTEGSVFDDSFISTNWFGVFCQYTASNATKFYFDDFYVGPAIQDTVPPEIQSVSVLSNQLLDVYFSESLTENSAQYAGNYMVSNAAGNPATAILDENDQSLVHLTFENTFEIGQNWLYAENIEDLAGNILEIDSLAFNYFEGETPEPGSVLITEIMADVDPQPASLPAADYIELFNHTNEIIDLNGCTLKPRESADPILFETGIILPDSFLIVTHTADTASFLPYGNVVGLPGFSLNNEGTIVLRNANGELLHTVSYTKEWYKSEEKQEGGWALEMIDPSKPCAGIDDWIATAEVAGGTPGKTNTANGNIYAVPQIDLVQITGPNEILLKFNHDMDSLSIINLGAYQLADASLMPVSAICSEIHFSQVLLNFDYIFEENVVYTLILTDTLFNCAGDFITPGITFEIVRPSAAEPWDIVINEIMADPDPPVGLPEYEFIEIFNTTEKYLDINDWILLVGTVEKNIPDFIIEPGEYVLFADDDVSWLFEMFGHTVGFSTLGLTNGGASVSLMNGNDELISTVTYNNNWFADDEKAEGGWSLEQIDPYNPCAGADNWSESIAAEGGTPGKLNSVDGDNPIDPVFISVVSISEQEIKLTFNQVMDPVSILNPEAYFVDHTVGNPAQIIAGDSIGYSVILTFSEPLLYANIYELRTELPIYNCRGLEMQAGTTIQFGISQTAQKSDLVINEVLFNPAGNGVDFVEVYNRSKRVLDLDEMYLGHVDTDEFGNSDTIYKNVSSQPGQILPGTYLVLTTDPERVKSQYYTSNPEGFHRMTSFPVYSNEKGTVVLAKTGKRSIDVFEYNESMHYPLLTTVEGVSLERIDFDRPSYDETNWHSASGEVGYATPAYQNSQYKGAEETEDEVTINPETFSPDNDGFDDVLNIQYRFDQPGYNASIRIYDSRGRLTRILVNNELLGTEGAFSWDGRTDDNQKASIGIYIIYVEVFDLNRNVKKYKKTAVLGGRIGN
ncbi:MAG TPA: lamin tail domain-containing protein [Bacteroidales bacterium]|nr:lamin tail domain-containing protein [Bacteroidales bacterium]